MYFFFMYYQIHVLDTGIYPLKIDKTLIWYMYGDGSCGKIAMILRMLKSNMGKILFFD